MRAGHPGVRRWLQVVLLGALLLAPAAWAYIPETGWLLARVAEKREKMGLRRLKVLLRCEGPGTPSHAETLYISSPGKVRRERADGALEICQNGRCWLKTAGDKPAERPAWAYLQYFYFAEGTADGERLLRVLRGVGVDTRANTVGRFFSRVAFVLGAKEWERDRPQFWLDKDLYLPLRLMVRDGKALVDLVWRNWGSRSTGDWFPGVIEVRRDGELVESCEAVELEANRSLGEELFQLPK